MAKKGQKAADPAARVLAACEDAGVELVRFLYVDHGGVVTKAAPSADARKFVKSRF